MTREEAIRTIKKYAPCDHTRNVVFTAGLWRSCEDCGQEFLETDLPKIRAKAQQFEEALEALMPPAPREAVKVSDGDLYLVIGRVLGRRLTPGEREWCLQEIHSVKGYDRMHFENADDPWLARHVIASRMAYLHGFLEKKGNLCLQG